MCKYLMDEINKTNYSDTEIMETSLENAISGLEGKLNKSLEMEKMSEILENFYKDLNNETDYVLITLYVPVIVLAFLANIMVIAVVLKYDYMRSVTNYFVVNLSIADLLVTLICMPMAVSQAVSIIWLYGEIMCKLFFYLQGVAVAASVFTITAMSIDRYLAIRSPIALRRVFNRKSTIMIIATLWIIALSIFAPVLSAVTLQSPDLPNITQLHDENEGLRMIEPPVFQFCSEDFKTLGIHAHVFGAICFVLVYAIPGCIVVVAYSLMGRTLCARKPPFDSDNNEGSASSQQGFRLVRERKRVAWILLTLAVLFALCWLPYNVLRLLIDLGVIYEGSAIPAVLSYFLFLGHANSALNPIVYCFMTRNFRRSVRKLICRGNHGFNQPKSHRKSLGGVCVGSGIKQHGRWDCKRAGTFAIAAAARPHARMALDRSATSSSGYDSSYSRHSPHRRCYMLKNMPHRIERAAAAACSPAVHQIHRNNRESHLLASSLHDVDDTTRNMDPRRSQSFHALSTVVAPHQLLYESVNHTTQFTNDI